MRFRKSMNGKKKDVVCIDNSNKTRHLGNHHIKDIEGVYTSVKQEKKKNKNTFSNLKLVSNVREL